jgi:hypothetical protein
MSNIAHSAFTHLGVWPLVPWMSPVLAQYLLRHILTPKKPKMTIPASKLWAKLWQCEAIDLRRADGTFEGNISGTDARAYALIGLVEGVATPSGRVKYVRRLTHVVNPEIASAPIAENYTPSKSGPIAQTNMGVHHEYLCQAIVELDRNDRRVVVGEGGAMGWTYAPYDQPPSNWRELMGAALKARNAAVPCTATHR